MIAEHKSKIDRIILYYTTTFFIYLLLIGLYIGNTVLLFLQKYVCNVPITLIPLCNKTQKGVKDFKCMK